MSHPEDLVLSCQARLNQEGIGDEVIAAGAFSLQDSYKAIEAGGVASAFLPGSSNPLLSGIEGAGAIQASRYANAAAKGVTERMMVCVTESEIFVFAVHSTMGNDPGEILARFDRAGAEVEVKKFVGAKRLHITEGDQKMFLQGSTVRINPDAGGDKAVLAALA